MSSPAKLPIPITIFTGFLGSGKTTVILGLLPQLPADYKIVLLKNEFGDVEVDSQLAKQSSLAAVSEILNGCMCCVLVGQMKTALLEIRDMYHPDRIIIESSGSAFPATLAFQVRDLEKETDDFKLDAIVTVIDAENFTGYEDTSVTAKLQAQYTDLLLLNKCDLVSERQLDIVMDHLFTLNEQTPKLRCKGRGMIMPSLIFSLDSKLWQGGGPDNLTDASHKDEVEVTTISRGSQSCSENASCVAQNCDHVHTKVDISHLSQVQGLTEQILALALEKLPKESVYRVKGFVDMPNGRFILNWAFGRWELTAMDVNLPEPAAFVLLTMMGEPGEIKKTWGPRLAKDLGALAV